MIVKEITYVEPLSGEELTEKFYFHINSAEALRIMGRSGNKEWETYVKEVDESGDADRIMDFIEQFVYIAVGYKNVDGRFTKTKDFRDEFMASEAYGKLFVDFIQDEKFARKFFSQVIEEGRSNKDKGHNSQLEAVANKGNRQQRRSKK